MLWNVVISLFFLRCLMKLWRIWRRFWHTRNIKCGIKPWPILGHLYMALGNGEDRMNSIKKIGTDALTQGGISKAWCFFSLYAIIADPIDADFVLKTHLGKNVLGVNVFNRLIGKGSLFSSVKRWRNRRDIVAPMFNTVKVRKYSRTFNSQAMILIKQLEKNSGGEAFSIFPYMLSYSMDSICETNMGLQMESQLNPKHDFFEAMNGFSSLATSNFCNPWFSSDIVCKIFPKHSHIEETVSYVKYLHKFIDDVIIKKKAEVALRANNVPNEQNTNKNTESDKTSDFKTFLEMMIESSDNGKTLSDTALREEALILILAGTETSAIGLSFFFTILSRHPELQEVIYKEITHELGDVDRDISKEDLEKLRYLDSALKEVLRLYPPIPVVLRSIEQDTVLPASGVTLAQGTGAMINIWAIQRNPKYWGSDAEDFKPTRFMDKHLENTVAFMPFSCGPRNCVGYRYSWLVMKIAIVRVIKKYRILPSPESEKQPKNAPLRVETCILMKSVDGFAIKLELRNNC